MKRTEIKIVNWRKGLVSMRSQLAQLAADIENYRKEMVHLATVSSLTDRNVIEASTKLDSLLNMYQLLKKKA